MRTRTAVAAALLTLLITVQADAQRPQPEWLDEQIQEQLPEPSLTEPFEIGEALHDPGRLDDAVVSMLALMRIAVVPDPGPATGPKETHLALSVSEVRALIEMGQEDLQSADDIENLPYSFADLHRAVAGLVPGVSTEQMAQAYTRAYEMAPEDLVAKALMGRPIEPEMTLTRTQIWFLLMDGFAGAAAGGGRWGTADRQLPDARSPNPEWSAAEWLEVLARLPLITASRLVTISAPDVITQGTAKIAPVNVTVRMNAAAPPLVSRVTGRTLIPARAGSLAGQEVTWRAPEDSILEEIGTVNSPTGEATRIGADGLARFAFQPGIDPTRGAGETIDDWETIEARFETRGLLASAYTVPAPLTGLALGSSRTRADLHLRWRSSDVLWVLVHNAYHDVNFQTAVGGGVRDGGDAVFGKLSKRKDGSYAGTGTGRVGGSQVLRGPSLRLRVPCQVTAFSVKQELKIVATPEHPLVGFGPTKNEEDIKWANAQGKPTRSMKAEPPDGGYYRLEFFPKTTPDRRNERCWPFIPAGRDRQGYGATRFIPFNDAQWTTSGQGYGIALRAKGLTFYHDESSVDPLAGTPLAKVKDLFQLTGASRWLVRVARTWEEFDIDSKSIEGLQLRRWVKPAHLP